MIYDIPMPNISPAFTIEDIHKIREWNYERLKDAAPDERREDRARRAEEAMARFGLKYGRNEPKASEVF